MSDTIQSIIYTVITKAVASTKEFCQAEKIPKIREKLGSGWVGQARARFFLRKVYFCCCCTCFEKKNG